MDHMNQFGVISMFVATAFENVSKSPSMHVAYIATQKIFHRLGLKLGYSPVRY